MLDSMHNDKMEMSLTRNSSSVSGFLMKIEGVGPLVALVMLYSVHNDKMEISLTDEEL
jgi:Holliday junction resolvasome RuvABC DNA-binding subunit